MSNPRDFYDGLASGYHRMFADWDASMHRQARALATLIPASAMDILDCACGIGTQAIGLAALGHRVRGTDISPVAAADMRRLPFAAGAFDAVVSADNAVCHLLSAPELVEALAQARRVLRPDGVLILSIRDYDALRVTRPTRTAPQLSIVDSQRSFTFQRWHWHDDGERYDLEHVQVTGGDGDWRAAHRSSTLWALTRAQLDDAARRAGFVALRWYPGDELGFHQPVLLAR